MNAKRKRVTDFILENIARITPGDTKNRDLMKKRLDSLSDKEFENYLKRLKPAKTPEEIANREILPLYIPNLAKMKVSIANNYRHAKDLGKSLEHRLLMTDPSTGNVYLTPHIYPVFDLPVRRQAQTIVKKRSIPEHSKKVDDLTDQPIGESKGSRISAPELVSLSSRGLDDTILEFIKIRSGDASAYREMKRQLIETGECNLDQVIGLGKVKSTKTLSTFFNCMHIGNNIDPDTRVPDDARSSSN